MQSFLAKCAAVGIVAGGFTLTGDLGRIADRGRQLLNATDVPPPRPAAEEAPQPGEAARPAAAQASRQPAPRATSAGSIVAPPQPAAPWRLPGDAPPDTPPDAPVGRSVAMAPPAAGGADAIDLRQLEAGSRLLVWVRRPGSRDRGATGSDLVALDIIDPAAGEALEHRHAAVAAGGRGPVHAAPRRVLIAVDGAGRLSRGDSLRLAPLRGVNGTAAQEEIGRVLALDVKAP